MRSAEARASIERLTSRFRDVTDDNHERKAGDDDRIPEPDVDIPRINVHRRHDEREHAPDPT